MGNVICDATGLIFPGSRLCELRNFLARRLTDLAFKPNEIPQQQIHDVRSDAYGKVFAFYTTARSLALLK